MKITQIGEDAYKVRIAESELAAYGIDYVALDHRKDATLRLLKDVLHKISDQYIREYMLNQMLVEFFPDERGGCYLYLNPKSVSEERSGKKAEERKIECARFVCRDDLLDFICTAFRENSTLQSDLPVYQMGNRYYLCRNTDSLIPSCVFAEFSDAVILGEFETALLQEYGKRVWPDLKKEKTQTEK